MQRCILRAAIVGSDLNQNVVGLGLGIFDEDIEVAILIEDAGIDQLKFRLTFPAPTVFFNELPIRKFGLRIFVEHLQVRMSGRRVEIVIKLFDVFAVVAFGAGEAEKTFLKDRVTAVPQGKREAEQLLVIAESADAIFSPAIGAGAGMVVWEMIPRSALGRIILADSAPLALGEIRAPFAPVFHAGLVLLQPVLLCVGSHDALMPPVTAWIHSNRAVAAQPGRE